MSEYLHLVSPVGRLVRGSLTERAKTDYDGNPYADGEGPFEIGLAISKQDAATGTFLGQLYQKAVQDAPNLKAKIDAEWSSGFTVGAFRFKVRDGDKPNQKNQINQNTVGCYVLNFSTSLPSKFTYTDAYGLKLTDPMGQPIAPRSEISPTLIKIGDYAHVSLSCKYNGKVDHTAGLYLSQNAIMLAGYGEAISGGLSLDEAFASVPVGQLPTGASVAALPGNAAPAPAAATTGLPLPGGSPAPAGTPTLPTAAPSNPAVAPHTQFLNAAPAGLPLPGQG